MALNLAGHWEDKMVDQQQMPTERLTSRRVRRRQVFATTTTTLDCPVNARDSLELVMPAMMEKE
jgi:hypothetical protein